MNTVANISTRVTVAFKKIKSSSWLLHSANLNFSPLFSLLIPSTLIDPGVEVAMTVKFGVILSEASRSELAL